MAKDMATIKRVLTRNQFNEVVSAAKSKSVTGLYEADSLSGFSWTLRGTEKTPSRNGKWTRTSTFYILSVVQPNVDSSDPKFIKAHKRFSEKAAAASALFEQMRENAI